MGDKDSLLKSRVQHSPAFFRCDCLSVDLQLYAFQKSSETLEPKDRALAKSRLFVSKLNAPIIVTRSPAAIAISFIQGLNLWIPLAYKPGVTLFFDDVPAQKI